MTRGYGASSLMRPRGGNLKNTRRESREVAFALLFEWSFKDDTLDEIIENAAVGSELPVDAFARALAGCAIEHCPEIDKIIGRYSEKWKVSRLSRVTLAVLRMSVCELLHFDDIPVGATINEAVELAKKFSTEDEAAYINGILGAFERARSGKAAAEPEQPAPEEAPPELGPAGAQ